MLSCVLLYILQGGVQPKAPTLLYTGAHYIVSRNYITVQKCCFVFGKIKKKNVFLNLSQHFMATLNTLEFAKCKVLLYLLMHSVKVLSYIIMFWFLEDPKNLLRLDPSQHSAARSSEQTAEDDRMLTGDLHNSVLGLHHQLLGREVVDIQGHLPRVLRLLDL